MAFAGRSNVGKSSLINAVTMAPVARQSDKPGKTQSLNFYAVKDGLRLVDLPGYGFAFANELRQARWTELMDSFLVGRGTTLKARNGVGGTLRRPVAVPGGGSCEKPALPPALAGVGSPSVCLSQLL